jgi:hypothetical protein
MMHRGRLAPPLGTNWRRPARCPCTALRRSQSCSAPVGDLQQIPAPSWLLPKDLGDGCQWPRSIAVHNRPARQLAVQPLRQPISLAKSIDIRARQHKARGWGRPDRGHESYPAWPRKCAKIPGEAPYLMRCADTPPQFLRHAGVTYREPGSSSRLGEAPGLDHSCQF